VQRLYREEGLSVRKRRGRKKATGMRAPLLTVPLPKARWSIDFASRTFGSSKVAGSGSSTSSTT